MNFEEHRGKSLLAEHGIRIPKSALANDAHQAGEHARTLGPCVIKAQVPTGKRGKAGAIRMAQTPQEAEQLTNTILAMTVDGWQVHSVLVEQQIAIAQEMYMAIINDPVARCPLLLFSDCGGMDIEEIASAGGKLQRLHVDIRQPLAYEQALALTACRQQEQAAHLLCKLYEIYRTSDAELIEINPLVITADNELYALDCKFVLDDSAAPRQEKLVQLATKDAMTELEARAANAGLKYIELGGNIGILANGAGLTMTSMDCVSHYGGNPANFLEIGGDAYTKGHTALEILLANPRITSLLINFCGAFARTDVMAKGVIEAWKKHNPSIPVFFSVHGTGDTKARELIKTELGMSCFDTMEDAVQAAVAAGKT